MWGLQSINNTPLAVGSYYTYKEAGGSSPVNNTASNFGGSGTFYGESTSGSVTQMFNLVGLSQTSANSIATVVNSSPRGAPTHSTTILSTSTTTDSNLLLSHEYTTTDSYTSPTTANSSSLIGTGTKTSGYTFTDTTSLSRSVTIFTATTESVIYTGGTSSRYKSSDCATVTTSISRSTTVQSYAQTDFYKLIFGDNEWAWTFNNFAAPGYNLLDAIADSLGTLLLLPITSTRTTSSADPLATFTFLMPSTYLSGTASYSSTISTLVTTLLTGLNPALHDDYTELPTPTDSYSAYTTNTSSTVITFGPTTNATGNTTLSFTMGALATVITPTPTVGGASGSSGYTFSFKRSTSVPAPAYDSKGYITGISSAITTTVKTSTGLSIINSQGGFISNSTVIGTSTLRTVGAGSYTYLDNTFFSGYASLLPSATVYEATFSPALRLNTSGKFNQITGPASSIYYPFFSNVWRGLNVPMTYAHSKTALWQQTVTTEIEDDDGGSLASTTLLEDADSTSYSYSWKRTATAHSVYATGHWQNSSDATTSSSSTSFVMGTSLSNDFSFFTTFAAYPLGTDADYSFAIGGKQWNDVSESAVLSPGIWGISKYAGTSTGESQVTLSNYSIFACGSASILAFKPVPAWGSLNAENVLYTLYVAPKWEYP